MSFKQRFHFRHIIWAVGWKMDCEWCGGKDWESDRRKVTMRFVRAIGQTSSDLASPFSVTAGILCGSPPCAQQGCCACPICCF